MTLTLNAYSPVSNKLLIALSGITRNHKIETADGRTEYHYEKHEYGIKDSYLSFTWSQIKQMLLFVGLSDSDGNIIHVKESDLAAAMKCSERTVQRNNKIFSDTYYNHESILLVILLFTITNRYNLKNKEI